MSRAEIPQEIHCRHCGNHIDRNLSICRHCGVRNQYAQPARSTETAASDRRESLRPDHTLATTTQAWTGVKRGFNASLLGILGTTLLFLPSLSNIFWNIPDVIRQIPAVSAAAAGGAITQSIPMAVAKFLVWLFFGANFVSVSSSATAGETSRSMSSNVLTEIGSVTSLSPVLFHGLVLALVVIAGYKAAKSVGYDEVHENAAAGASVAIGYGLFGLLGAMVAGIGFGRGPASASVGPPLVLSVAIFTGLGLVCGSIGGLLRHAKDADAF